MRRIILLGFFCSSFSFAQLNANKIHYAPGEIIIKYEKYGADAKGSEILSEHQNILEKLKPSLRGIKIISCSPVFKNVINEMITKNQTEAHLFSIATVNKKSNLPASVITKTSFSNVLLLKIEKMVEDIESLAVSINKNPNLLVSDGIKIVYAEPNYLKTSTTDSNDPLFSQQWSHQVTNIEQAWRITQGNPDVKIGIIDTGVDPTHPDLANNLLTGYDFVDIDTTNYKSIYGTSCLLPGEDYTQPDKNCADYNGHGTHCAGIAAAVGDNNIGIKGVAPNCKILPIRAGFSIKNYDGENGETGIFETTSIVNAIAYAVDQGANVISMAFNGDHSNLEEEVIKYAAYKNVVLVAAAGNNKKSIEKSYPAGYDEVLAITSINKEKKASSFTNYGAWTDIAAPGEDIISTVPTTGGNNSDPAGYKILSGTSMAAPYIAGVAGLLLSKDPNLSNNQVYQLLRNSVSTNYSSHYYIGTGLIDVYKALSGNEAGVAKITSPHNMSSPLITSQDLNISGRAYGTNFKNYVFDYSDYVFDTLIRDGAKPNWKPLDGFYSTPVDSGFLGTIHIDQQGVYWIRLRVISASNVEYTDIIGPVTVDKRMKPNWPVSTGYQSLSSPAVSDTDHDGKMETIFACTDGKIYVVEQDGKNKPGWPVQLPGDIYSSFTQVGCSSPSVADIDNDSMEEIIVRDGNQVYVYGYDGKIEKGWPRQTDSHLNGNTVICSPVIADIDNDEEKEILLTNVGRNNNGELVVFKSDGRLMSGWPVAIPLNWGFSTIFINPVVSDLDGDGNNEIILQCLDETLKKGYLYVFNTSGNILPGWPREIGIGSRTSPIAADINQDGQNEIIASSVINADFSNSQTGIFVFNKAGAIWAGWPVILNINSSGSGISAGDINNDGFMEILVGSNDPKNPLWAIDKNGHVVWSLPGATVAYVTFSTPLIVDINGDSKPEILISRLRVENCLGSILTVDNTGHIMQDQKFLVPEKIYSTPTIADMDDDNKLELICPTDKGNIFCWDLDAPNDPSKIIWPTFQLNNQRTGSIEPPRIPATAQLAEPLNNAINQPLNITFKWNPFPRAISYRFQISDTPLFGFLIREDTSVARMNYPLTGLTEGQKYYWRVQAKNNTGSSPWSDVWNFTTTLSAPTKLVLQRSAIKEITLTWTDNSNGEDGYIIQRKQSPRPMFVLLDTLKGSGNKFIDKEVEQGSTYTYRIKAYTNLAQSDYSNEASTVVTVIVGVEEDNMIPTEYSLLQNYPNPFNLVTKIKFGLPENALTKLTIHDALGREVSILLNRELNVGYHEVDFDASNFTSGIYFYRLQAGYFCQTKKVILLK